MPARRSGPREALTQQRIAEVALGFVAERGYEALTMRTLADRLDTGPASLYVHVRDKTELDRILVEELLRRTPRRTPSPDRWREHLRDWFLARRRLIATFPGVALALAASLPGDRDTLDRQEEEIVLFRALGLDVEQAAAAQVALTMFWYGRVIEDALIARRITESGLSPRAWWGMARRTMSQMPDHPAISAQGRLLTAAGRDDRTREALEIILDGIAARYGVADEI